MAGARSAFWDSECDVAVMHEAMVQNLKHETINYHVVADEQTQPGTGRAKPYQNHTAEETKRIDPQHRS